MVPQNLRKELEFRKFFAKRLLTARLAVNLTQKGLAKRLGTGQDTISNYERGKVLPSILTIFQLSQILAVNVAFFFPDERFSQMRLEEQSALALVPSLSPIAYDFLLTLIQALAHSQRVFLIHNLRLSPTKILERYLVGNLRLVEPSIVKDPQENKSHKTKPELYLLVSLTYILLKGLEGELIDSYSRQLFERIASDKNFLPRLLQEFTQYE